MILPVFMLKVINIRVKLKRKFESGNILQKETLLFLVPDMQLSNNINVYYPCLLKKA